MREDNQRLLYERINNIAKSNIINMALIADMIGTNKTRFSDAYRGKSRILGIYNISAYRDFQKSLILNS